MIFELLTSKSLLSILKDKPERKIKEKECKKLIIPILDALQYLHSQNIVHRDIKLENIIMDKKNNAKLIDFGFSVIISNDQKLKVFCGTPSYMAPEIVAKQEYNGFSVDIWSIGVLLYTMLSGFHPFQGSTEKELYKKIFQGNYSMPTYFSYEAKNLISKILTNDPKKRISIKEVFLTRYLMIHFSKKKRF